LGPITIHHLVDPQANPRLIFPLHSASKQETQNWFLQLSQAKHQWSQMPQTEDELTIATGGGW